jgi:hypothetical protein
VVSFTVKAALGKGEEPTAEAAVWATEPVCTAPARNRIQIPRWSSPQPRTTLTYMYSKQRSS